MGLFSFLRGAGRKHDNAEQEADLAVAIKEAVNGSGLDIKDFGVRVDGETALVRGVAGTRADAEKAVLIAGNTQGIAQVDDKMEVVPPRVRAAGEVAAAGAKKAAAAIAAKKGGVDKKGGAKSAAGGGEKASTFHTVGKGDSLGAIAKKYYGKASRYPEIFEANKPMLSDPNKIYPGQVLRIPAE